MADTNVPLPTARTGTPARFMYETMSAAWVRPTALGDTRSSAEHVQECKTLVRSQSNPKVLRSIFCARRTYSPTALDTC
jgi:hypothetical protein